MNLFRTALILLFCSVTLFAADNSYRSKYGFDVKGFKPARVDGIGWIGGLRAARYFGTSQVSVGLAGYFGAPTGQDPTEAIIYYGGLHLGYDGRLSKFFVYEFSIVMGYGEARFRDLNIHQKSYFVAEPSAAIGFGLGGGWRMLFNAGYIQMTEAPAGSGGVFGVRFQYRSSTSIKDIND